MNFPMLWVIVWTGGYEAPSYSVKSNKTEAFELAQKWAMDAKEGEDTIDVLEINSETCEIRRVEWEEVTA